MAATTAQENREDIRAVHADIAPPPGQAAPEGALAEIAANLLETQENRKQVLVNLVTEIAEALIEFGQTIKDIDQRIKNKQVPKTSKKCLNALKCIQKALQKSIYKDPNVYKNLSKPDGEWRNEYTTGHKTLYENIKECMKSNLEYTANDNQLLFDFRNICLQIKINGKEIITDKDATSIERLINALNNIETEYIESSIELLQIMAMSTEDSENGIGSIAYLMQWTNLWKTLLFVGGIGACIGLQSVLEPMIITSHRVAGAYFDGGLDKYGNPIHYVFDTAVKQFVIAQLPPGARPITCPENIGYALFSGVSNSRYTLSPYICTAGQIIMYMPWLNVIREMLHTTMTMPANLLSYIETMPITTNYNIAGIVAVAGMIGFAGFKARTYFNKRKREGPSELEEIVTTGLSEGTAVAEQLAASQAQASSSTNRQQSKRPRVARSGRT